ncbi:MAG: sigma-70 family RNA polymerase sigma factor [Chloroflexota bacterium]
MQSELLDHPSHAEFDALYRECAVAVFNFVQRSLGDREQAQDICQEIWAKVYRGLPDVRDAATVRPWLFRIARNAIVDSFRSRSVLPRTVALEVDPAHDEPDPLNLLVRKDQGRLALQALGALPPRQQLALYLREIEGQSYAELARDLDCSESAVETLLWRARRSFAERFEGVASDRAGRCVIARRILTTWMDGEGTAAERRALEAHLDECANCCDLAETSRRHEQARGLLPLFPAPLWGSGLSEAATLAQGLFAQIVALFSAKAAAVAVATAMTAVVITAVAPAAYEGAQSALRFEMTGTRPPDVAMPSDVISGGSTQTPVPTSALTSVTATPATAGGGADSVPGASATPEESTESLAERPVSPRGGGTVNVPAIGTLLDAQLEPVVAPLATGVLGSILAVDSLVAAAPDLVTGAVPNVSIGEPAIPVAAQGSVVPFPDEPEVVPVDSVRALDIGGAVVPDALGTTVGTAVELPALGLPALR